MAGVPEGCSPGLDRLKLARSPGIQRLLKHFKLDEKVVCSDLVVKVNHRNKSQERVFVVTTKALYNFLPSSYRKCKRRILLSDIGSVTLSTNRRSNEFVVHVPAYYDYRVLSAAKHNFIRTLQTLYKLETGNELFVREVNLVHLDPLVVTKVMSKSKKQSIIDALKQIDQTAINMNPDAMKEIFKTWDTGQASPVGLNDFKLKTIVGKGSFGKVYCVEKLSGPDKGANYALKVLSKERIREKNQVEHTMSERKVMCTIKHPNLMSLHYAFQSTDKLYFVMDFLTGGELFFHLQKQHGFTFDQARYFSGQIVLGLGHLHENDIIYRDLKPENCLLDKEGNLKLCDFGLSKMGVTDTTSTFCGTFEYMAPEMVKRQPHGKGVDWWAWGVMLYEMICGLPPFWSENMQIMFEKIMSAPLEFPEDVPNDVKTIVTKVLIRDPKKRLGSGKADLKEIMGCAFFSCCDWQKMYKKEYSSPFRPNESLDKDHQDDPFGCVDGELLNEVVEPLESFKAGNDAAGEFAGFNYGSG